MLSVWTRCPGHPIYYWCSLIGKTLSARNEKKCWRKSFFDKTLFLIFNIKNKIALSGFNIVAFFPSYIDLCPNYNQVLNLIGNLLFSTEGFLVPHLLANFISIDPYGNQRWEPVWLICSIISASGGIIFILFGSTNNHHKKFNLKFQPSRTYYQLWSMCYYAV